MKNFLSLEAFETIRKAGEKLFNETLEQLNKKDENGKTPVTRLFDAISEKIEIGKTVLSPDSIKIALSYREFSLESIKFEKLLSIVKREYTLSPGMSICVLKTAGENGFTEFDIMACSAEKEVVFKPLCPWCHVVVAFPDPELLKMFGEKNMLVLK